MRTTPYHPMGNGQPERFNRTLLTMIGTLPRVEKANWQNWINHLTHAYNCTKSQVTVFSPYYLMFRREPRTPVDEAFKVTFPFRQEKNVHDYVHHLRERLQWAYNIAKEHIDKDVARRKLYYDCDDERSCNLSTHDCSSIPYPGSRDRQALFPNASSLHGNKEKSGFG